MTSKAKRQATVIALTDSVSVAPPDRMETIRAQAFKILDALPDGIARDPEGRLGDYVILLTALQTALAAIMVEAISCHKCTQVHAQNVMGLHNLVQTEQFLLTEQIVNNLCHEHIH